MNFYISKIQFWFRNGSVPRTLVFHPDKVNVITGASATGKSSILKVIDYCLLQDYCNIVQDVINESVSWYGILFYVDGKPYSIIRKAPTVEYAEMTVILRETDFLPQETPLATEQDQRSRVMVRLNEIFGIPTKLKLESKVKLNFRHFLLFNYLTEDIIATESTYQDLGFFRDKEYMKVLDDLFKLVIGHNEPKVKNLELDLEDARRKQKSLDKKRHDELKKVKEHAERKVQYIQELIKLDIYDSTDADVTLEERLELLNKFIDNYHVHFVRKHDDNRRIRVSKELDVLKSKLQTIKSLEQEYETYSKGKKRQLDSLEPVKYIETHMEEVFQYYETGILMSGLMRAWKVLKDSYTPNVELPQNFYKHKNDLEKEILQKQECLDRLLPLQVKNPSMAWVRSVILLAEKIKKDLDKVPTISVNEEDVVRQGEIVAILEQNLIRLKAKNENAISDLNNNISFFLTMQKGLSESYRDCSPVYSMDNHSLMLERKGVGYPISNVGSKSNFMFLHLCYFFGLHYLMLMKDDSKVLPFLFVDQPSIPYYADRSLAANQTEGDDEKHLSDAFSLTNQFMKTVLDAKKHFQIIMVEHADPSYWANLDSFETIAVFDKNKGLIPERSIMR